MRRINKQKRIKDTLFPSMRRVNAYAKRNNVGTHVALEHFMAKARSLTTRMSKEQQLKE